MGDFNSVLASNERVNCFSIGAYYFNDLLHFRASNRLMDAPCDGLFFTWHKGNKLAKLDRVILNHNWGDIGADCKAMFLDMQAQSDHYPVLFDSSSSRQRKSRPFRFFNMWTKHEKFPQIVSRVWDQKIDGTKQFVLTSKLLFLKHPFKDLNRAEFGHISNRLADAKIKYKTLVEQLMGDPDSLELVRLVNKQRRITNFLIEAELAFYKQKAKCDFLTKGDICTKYFYSVVKKKRSTNSIPFLGSFSPKALDEVHLATVYSTKMLFHLVVGVQKQITHKGWEVTGKLHLLFFVCYLRRSLLCVAFSVAGQPGLLSPVCDFAGHRSSAAFFPSVTAAAAVRVDSDGNSSGENPSSPIRVLTLSISNWPAVGQWCCGRHSNWVNLGCWVVGPVVGPVGLAARGGSEASGRTIVRFGPCGACLHIQWSRAQNVRTGVTVLPKGFLGISRVIRYCTRRNSTTSAPKSKKGFAGIVGGLLAKKGKRAQSSTSSSGTTVSSHNELAMYQGVPCDYDDDDVDFDVLGWWKRNEHMFPCLGMLARQVLSVPVSTVAVEREFSAGGNILTDYRSCLNAESLETLVCNQDWLLARRRAQESSYQLESEHYMNATTDGSPSSEE
ncbi:hypothetical protein DM860_012202 [Cuscuta australis]|uniref:HAT C-terminal dimerisation domain-containing protein n=4 Tax=Cuscuta sect. Cleistogrammica TaxID=1824901 RepID=A0A328E6S7_9ASTE|nr:hypothetical protein DM860_012202 [Cuscuta australis]